MLYFIKTTKRTTRAKYLVEAETRAEALRAEGEYLGAVDGNDDEFDEMTPAYTTEAEALDSEAAYTEHC